jgi:hypothetical protein
MNIATTPREYQFRVYCECGESFPPISKHVESAGETVRLVCPNCKTQYSLPEAKAMIQRGRFVCVAGEGSASGSAWHMPDTRLTE